VRRSAAALLAGAVAAIQLLAGGSPASAVGGAAAEPSRALLPNLWTRAPTGFRVDRGRTRTLLRVTNSIVNVGAGPIELDPRKTDCNGDGDLGNDRTAIQRIYVDADGDGAYDPAVDTGSATRRVGCFRFDRRHRHWHFKNYAGYELARASDGVVVATHRKVGFCLVDTEPIYPGIPGSPDDAVYNSCASDRAQGISPGWSDVYDQSLPGQFVDVTSVPDGRYCFRSTVDPADRIREADEADNSAAIGLRLRGDAVAPLAGVC
jgi:hypothetical protein